MLVNSKFKGPMSAPIVLPVKEPTELPEGARNSTALTAAVGPNANFIFYPGWNRVPEDVWSSIVAHIQDHIDNQRLEVRGKVDKSTGELIDVELWDLGATEARTILKGCFNPRDVKFWASHEKMTAELRHIAQIQKKGIETGQAPDWGEE